MAHPFDPQLLAHLGAQACHPGQRCQGGFDRQAFVDQFAPHLKAQIPVQGAVSPEDFWALLGDPQACTRDRLQGHITTSALIFHPAGDSCLLVLHRKYNQWIYPGGHADGDWLWLRSCLREVYEETKLGRLGVIAPRRQQAEMFYPHFVQGFEIGAYGNEPAHIHFDAVYLLQAASAQGLHFDASESKGLRWFRQEEFENIVRKNSAPEPSPEPTTEPLSEGAGVGQGGVTLLTAKLCLQGFSLRNEARLSGARQLWLECHTAGGTSADGREAVVWR